MPRPGLAVLGLLALSAGVAAQSPPPAATPQNALVPELYLQARQSIASVPSLLAPGMLSAIARDELPPQRPSPPSADQPALSDFRTAFALALALPESTDDPVLDPVRARIKSEVEQEAVAELARHHDFDGALQLTRSADAPKEPLYNQLVLALAFDRSPTADGAQSRLDALEALVDECERTTGEFPFRGVAVWLRRTGDPGLDQMLLVQDGYQWAQQVTDPSRIWATVPFLRTGHQKEPELDQDLESTLAALLSNLSNGPVTLTPAAPNAARGLLSLFHTLDPVQAAQWQQQWPQMSLSGGRAYSFRLGLQARRLQLQLLPPPPASSGADPSAQAAPLRRFQELVHQAESLRHRHPRQALSAASLASSLLNQALWPFVLPLAVRLAALERDLGDSRDAAALLQNCLDAADRQARSDDALYLNASPSALAIIASDVSRAAAPVLEAYSEAARMNFATTAAHAESAQFTLLKPLVLARVALIGALASRRHPAI